MNKILRINDRRYPTLLKEIFKPPKRLYYKGKLDAFNKPLISIVGTRKNSEYGKFVTKKIIDEISILDVAIVSGLAKGIDTIAHTVALENGLPTIAVLGTGIEYIYPKENIKLAKKIIENGMLISEYEPDQPPLRHQFPERNRLISGMSIATIVIEAPERSGALITARLSLEQNREVFVVPGDIDRPNSQGTLRLLQNTAAIPILSGKDVVEVLKEQPHLFNMIPEERIPRQKLPRIELRLSPLEKILLSIVPYTRGKTADSISAQTKFPISKVLSVLSVLEIRGLVSSAEGKYLKLV